MTSQELQALGFQKAGDVDVVDGVISSNLTPFASEVKSGVYPTIYPRLYFTICK